MILTYERRTHFPTRVGNVRFQVDDRGLVTVQVNREEPPAGADWRGEPVTRGTIAGAREKLKALLARHGFFTMAPRTDDERDDGYSERLVYWDETGSARTVVAEHGQSPDFRRLIKSLASTLDIVDELA
jgi:hypothetical protein